MAFDEAVVLVNAGDGLHLLLGQWLADDGLQGAEILGALDGERDGDVAVAGRPI